MSEIASDLCHLGLVTRFLGGLLFTGPSLERYGQSPDNSVREKEFTHERISDSVGGGGCVDSSAGLHPAKTRRLDLNEGFLSGDKQARR
jgi:hypothetical protein